ncbi:MAG: dihydropteroate synthase [Candidatus Euphemobacter frigidus]|nr:dihydropteroate synthase [Candidatus Euphemobacter frigidus]MDP8275737.1 dihydropteroate synthase [Candidatus Euphemobacter frigidus]
MEFRSGRYPFSFEWSNRWGRSFSLTLGPKTVIMGALNLTPDSFFDGGFYPTVDEAVNRALAMEEAGAGIIDLGGESTRPGAVSVPEEEELQRIMPVLERLVERLTIPISIDTYKAGVARRALGAGASIINDISALRFDPGLVSVVAESMGPYVMMHMKGTPGTMQNAPAYRDVMAEIKEFFRERLHRAEEEGITLERIIIDPGIGFGKTLEHNLTILAGLASLAELGRPILLGPSRKSFIGAILDKPPADRLWGTAGAVAACIAHGAHIIRVHDVEVMKDLSTVMDRVDQVGR